MALALEVSSCYEVVKRQAERKVFHPRVVTALLAITDGSKRQALEIKFGQSLDKVLWLWYNCFWLLVCAQMFKKLGAHMETIKADLVLWKRLAILDPRNLANVSEYPAGDTQADDTPIKGAVRTPEEAPGPHTEQFGGARPVFFP